MYHGRRKLGDSLTTAAGAAAGSIVPGVGTVIGGEAGTLVGSLFGHHNSYPNGNPSNLSAMDTLASYVVAQGPTAGTALATLRTIAAGGTTPGGQPAGSGGWSWNKENVNWSQPTGDAGRAAERAYAAMLLSKITGTTVTPAPAGATVPAPSSGTPAPLNLSTANLGLSGAPLYVALAAAGFLVYKALGGKKRRRRANPGMRRRARGRRGPARRRRRRR